MKIYLLCCHGNLPNSVICTKILLNLPYFLKEIFKVTLSQVSIRLLKLPISFFSLLSISCHSNKSWWTMTIKTIYVEAYVLYLYVGCLSHLWFLRGWHLNIFQNLPFMWPWQPVNFSNWDKFILNIIILGGLLKKKFYPNIANETAKNTIHSFHFKIMKSSSL